MSTSTSASPASRRSVRDLLSGPGRHDVFQAWLHRLTGRIFICFAFRLALEKI